VFDRTSRRTLLLVLLVLGAALALSVPTAERWAYAAEERHVADRLDGADCLTDWGTDEGAATGRTGVVGVAPDGLQVRVRLPYAYTVSRDGGPLYADTASTAVYRVSLAGVERLRGDRVAPCG
jgi:hypothetical protein